MGIMLGELVARLGGQLLGDPAIEITALAPLTDAGPSQITFLSNAKMRERAASCRASALILSAKDHELIGDQYPGARIICPHPYVYYARVSQWLALQKQEAGRVAGIAASASVDASANIAPSAWIGPQVTVEADVVIGPGARIDAGCFIGRGAKIGENTHLFANVSFHAECEIGARGIIHSGAVIGADGFGFANENGAWIKIVQSGRVLIADDVEIGANTCIDRGALADTIIEEGVKLDNQIQIGHNCIIGAHTAMAGCVGVAGSAVIGKYCTFGGAAMVLGHLQIADNVHISSGSMVSRSITEAGHYTGFYPLAKNAEWEKSAAIVRNLAAMREKIRALEKTVKSLTATALEPHHEQS